MIRNERGLCNLRWCVVVVVITFYFISVCSSFLFFLNLFCFLFFLFFYICSVFSFCSSAEEQDEWLEAISTAISEHTKKTSSFTPGKPRDVVRSLKKVHLRLLQYVSNI